MGYGRDRFVTHVDDNLLCGICTDVVEDAVIMPCGHSFCEECLRTWLYGDVAKSTCPVCRGLVTEGEVVPVHALRGIVDGLAVWCANAENGCKMILKLENAKAHLKICDFTLVKCHGCEGVVPRGELAEHHSSCQAIVHLTAKHITKAQSASMSMEDLSKQLALLECDLKNTKEALRDSENAVRLVEQDMKEMRYELKTRAVEEYEEFDNAWDPEYNYGYSPRSIAQLASFISRFMLTKPYYAERNSVFNSIKRCYDFYHSYPAYSQDVHMLLATAFASNWFTESQRRTLDLWLNNVTRGRLIR